MQSGMWRCEYGKPKAHSTAVRGVASDALNMVVITAGSEGKVKFWNFEGKGRLP